MTSELNVTAKPKKVNNDMKIPDVNTPDSTELPNQLEELARWYLNKQFSEFRNTHKSNQKVIKLPEDQREEFI